MFNCSSGQELQYISVLRNLPFLLKTWPDCIKKVLPKVKEILAKSGDKKKQLNKRLTENN